MLFKTEHSDNTKDFSALLFESYSHNSEEVTLHWMHEPITLVRKIQLPDFDLVRWETRKENMFYPNVSDYFFKLLWGWNLAQRIEKNQ